ncbi:MAG: D-alanyl-D-alanine carboxypeptidase/D-alanyl-D-alanine-endopeptidase [Xenococcaceae cyanobacterium]
MLEIISFGIISFLSEIFGRSSVDLEPMELLSWQNTELFILPEVSRDSVVETIIQDYLQTLASKGISPSQQGVWIQSDWGKLFAHNGSQARSAASLTKIATTLAALSTYGVDYQFETKIYAAGEINNGVLQGDLLVEGDGDPFFVWEEAIVLGNSLQKLGIREVTGKLIVNDKFYMNYKSNSLVAGELLLKSLNERLWTVEVSRQYLTLPLGTLRPQIKIDGGVGKQVLPTAEKQLLIRHQSLPLGEILQQMNIYSNNHIAQMLADAVGGASKVMSIAQEVAGVSREDISLINGSGLGEENKIAPHAACQMLMAIERLLKGHSLDLVDLFPLSGRDGVGTMENRSIPTGTALKTGTLNQVSALAGVIPTSDRGRIWFAIINSGSQIEYFRQEQDRLLQRLAQHWQLDKLDLTQSSIPYLGDPNRNQIFVESL